MSILEIVEAMATAACITLSTTGPVLAAQMASGQEKGVATAGGPVRPSSVAGNGSCTLVGGLRAPADMQVFDEGTQNRLWSGTIQRDQSVGIYTPSERITYFYRYGSNDGWKAVNAWCHNSDRVIVP